MFVVVTLLCMYVSLHVCLFIYLSAHVCLYMISPSLSHPHSLLPSLSSSLTPSPSHALSQSLLLSHLLSTLPLFPPSLLLPPSLPPLSLQVCQYVSTYICLSLRLTYKIYLWLPAWLCVFYITTLSSVIYIHAFPSEYFNYNPV